MNNNVTWLVSDLRGEYENPFLDGHWTGLVKSMKYKSVGMLISVADNGYYNYQLQCLQV